MLFRSCRGKSPACSIISRFLRCIERAQANHPSHRLPPEFALTQTSASVLLAPVAEDMRAVDAVIRRRLGSEVVLINQIGEYIISAGGKRLRPVILLLVANALGYKGEHHHELAAVVEFIHTATLLHDDVVDESDLRRGRKTANAVFGNAASVLVGDFLYSREIGRAHV